METSRADTGSLSWPDPREWWYNNYLWVVSSPFRTSYPWSLTSVGRVTVSSS